MKKALIIILSIAGALSIFLSFKSFNNKNNVIKLDEVKLKENITNKNALAIMVEKEDGTGYEVYKVNDVVSNTFPTTGYTFNSEKSGCVDANGNIIENSLSYNSESNKVSLAINRSANCYVYFDKVEEINWTYYGWNGNSGCSTASDNCATTSLSFDDASGEHLVALRSKAGAKYEGITIDDEVQVCALIDGTMKCADYFNPSGADVTADNYIESQDGTVRCSITSNDSATCSASSSNESCTVKSDGTANCNV